MQEPKKKTKCLLTSHDEEGKAITFLAPIHIMRKFKKFGEIARAGMMQEKWRLSVDPRFDFAEVVAFIKNFES